MGQTESRRVEKRMRLQTFFLLCTSIACYHPHDPRMTLKSRSKKHCIFESTAGTNQSIMSEKWPKKDKVEHKESFKLRLKLLTVKYDSNRLRIQTFVFTAQSDKILAGFERQVNRRLYVIRVCTCDCVCASMLHSGMSH